jgi:hypothetical protein
MEENGTLEATNDPKKKVNEDTRDRNKELQR